LAFAAATAVVEALKVAAGYSESPTGHQTALLVAAAMAAGILGYVIVPVEDDLKNMEDVSFMFRVG
jgi:hypothetical protein